MKEMHYKIDGFVEYFSPYIDEYGNPVERTRDKYPYSYDGYVIWRGGPNTEINGTVYSDRLMQWDHEKFERLSKKYVNPNSWNEKNPDTIEKFLQEYMDKPELKLILMMEYCNHSSGYPVWRFDYKI